LVQRHAAHGRDRGARGARRAAAGRGGTGGGPGDGDGGGGRGDRRAAGAVGREEPERDAVRGGSARSIGAGGGERVPRGRGFSGGEEVCDWLTSKGITCVLLKYRVPNAGPSWDQLCGCDRNTRSSLPLEDAQRTIGLVRFHAAEWHIDLHKIGVLGFSAGGHLVAMVSTHFDRRVYAAMDSADQESCRPDF